MSKWSPGISPATQHSTHASALIAAVSKSKEGCTNCRYGRANYRYAGAANLHIAEPNVDPLLLPLLLLLSRTSKECACMLVLRPDLRCVGGATGACQDRRSSIRGPLCLSLSRPVATAVIMMKVPCIRHKVPGKDYASLQVLVHGDLVPITWIQNKQTKFKVWISCIHCSRVHSCFPIRGTSAFISVYSAATL